MPHEVIPILRVADADRAIAWYGQLGFGVEWVHRFEPGLPAFASVAQGHARLYLSEHEGDASPDTLVYIRHSRLDEIAELLDAPVVDVPWGRELHVQDPDGNRLRIADPTDD